MNPYFPKQHKIINIQKVGSDLRIFTLTRGGIFKPGQFYMLGIFGFGEAPFTPTNYPQKSYLEFLVRNTEGIVTKKMFGLKIGNYIELRGPFGNGYNLEKFHGKNLLFIAGGCGLAPVKAGLEYAVKNKSRFQDIQLFYGVNTEYEIACREDLRRLGKNAEILITVAKPTKKWRGNSGFVTSLIDKNTVKKNTAVVLCGPPVMYKPVINKLLSSGITEKDIYVSLERRMYCGIGKCQHCTCGDKYVCLDGPVFQYNELKSMNYE